MAAPWEKYGNPSAKYGPDPTKVKQDQRADEDQQMQREAAMRATQAADRANNNSAQSNAIAAQNAEIARQRFQAELVAKGMMVDGNGQIVPNPNAGAAKPGKPMRQGDADKLAEQVDSYAALKDAMSGFQDDFAGNTVIGRLENWAQGAIDVGTPGQRQWWANFYAADNLIRNNLFGASLTESEKQAYAQTTVDPSMSPATVKKNIEERLEIARKALERRTGRLRSTFNNDEIDAAVGEFADDFSPSRRNDQLRDELGIQIDPAMLEGQQGGGDPSLGQVGAPLYGDVNQPLGGASAAQAIMGDAFQQGRFNGTNTETQVGATDENIVTPQDQAIAARLSKLWRSGASYDRLMQEYDAINREYDFGGNIYRPSVSGAVLKQQAGLPGRERPGFNPVATGRKSDAQNFKDGLLDTSAGAGALSYLDAGGLGLTDEVAGLFGGEEAGQQAQFAKEYLADNYPKMTLSGNVAGGLSGVALLQKGVRAGAKTASGMLGNQTARRTAARLGGNNARAGATANAAYGTAYGAGSDNENRLRGAGVGLGASMLGDMAGRGIAKSVGAAFAPDGGNLAGAIQNGVRPTLGQRVVNSGQGEAGIKGGAKRLAGRAINGIEEAYQSFPILGSAVAGSRAKGREGWQRYGFDRALGEVGERLPDEVQIGGDAFKYTDDVVRREYDAARSGMQFAPDQQYQQEFGDWQRDFLTNTLMTADDKVSVNDYLKNVVDSRLSNGAMDGDTYKVAASDIGKQIGKTTNAQQRDALSAYRDVFDSAARRGSDPDAVARMDAADALYSQYKPLKDAGRSASGDVAEFTPKGLAAVERRNKGKTNSYLYGDTKLSDYIRMGDSFRDRLPNSGTADRLMATQGAVGAPLVGATGWLGGAGALLPATAMTLPYMPLIDTLTKAAISGSRGKRAGIIGKSIKGKARALGRIGGAVSAPIAIPFIQE